MTGDLIIAYKTFSPLSDMGDIFHGDVCDADSEVSVVVTVGLPEVSLLGLAHQT